MYAAAQTQAPKRHSSLLHLLIFLDYVRKREAVAKHSSSTEEVAVGISITRTHVNRPPLPFKHRLPRPPGLILSGLQPKPVCMFCCTVTDYRGICVHKVCGAHIRHAHLNNKTGTCSVALVFFFLSFLLEPAEITILPSKCFCNGALIVSSLFFFLILFLYESSDTHLPHVSKNPPQVFSTAVMTRKMR